MLLIIIFTVVALLIFDEYKATLVEGYSVIENKEIDGSKYFFQVKANNNAYKIQCTQNQYEKIIVHEKLAYGISYKVYLLNPQKAKLIYLHFDDIIDNRHNP